MRWRQGTCSVEVMRAMPGERTEASEILGPGMPLTCSPVNPFIRSFTQFVHAITVYSGPKDVFVSVWH